jgi:hypothetical protein
MLPHGSDAGVGIEQVTHRRANQRNCGAGGHLALSRSDEGRIVNVNLFEKIGRPTTLRFDRLQDDRLSLFSN